MPSAITFGAMDESEDENEEGEEGAIMIAILAAAGFYCSPHPPC